MAAIDKLRVLRIGTTIARTLMLRVTQTRYTDVGTASNVLNTLRRKKMERNPDGPASRRVSRALETALPSLEVTCLESPVHVYDSITSTYISGLYLSGRVLCEDAEFLFSVDPNGTLTVRQVSTDGVV